MLGEETPEAQPIKEALLKAREQSRLWENDSTLKFIQRSRTRIDKIQADLTREQGLLQQAMESLERLRDEAASSVPEPVRHTGTNGPRRSRGRGSKVESPNCRVATRASSQAGGGREQGQESPRCQRPRWIWPQFTLVQQVRAMFPT